MTVELHLPDLPDVPIKLGPARGRTPRPAVPWHLRLRDALSAYLPLLLMALLALFTWWLVKNSPTLAAPERAAAVRHDPDYTMDNFSIERYAADGQLKVRIAGIRMRHYPDTDRIEADQARIRAIAPDGRVTLAQAARAISNGDGSEVQLIGSAQVVSGAGGPDPIVMNGEFLHAFFVTERVRSPLPVVVQQGGTELTAAGLAYDNGSGKLELTGPVHAVFPPRSVR